MKDYGNRGSLRRRRRQAVRKWGKTKNGPGIRLFRRILLTGAAMELVWVLKSSPHTALSPEGVVELHQIGERSQAEASGLFRNPVRRSGVKIRLKDGSISIFKVNEYLESD